MTEKGLEASGVNALVSQCVTTGMAELMRVDLELEPCSLSSPRYKLPEARNGEGRCSLGKEDKRAP